jgi:hypothetical protein
MEKCRREETQLAEDQRRSLFGSKISIALFGIESGDVVPARCGLAAIEFVLVSTPIVMVLRGYGQSAPQQ